MDINLEEAELLELYKCQASPVYMAERYGWIEENETAAVIPFNMLDFRREILLTLKSGKNLLVHKSRRASLSWTVCFFAAWLINFKPGVKILFLSRKEDDAKQLLAKVKFALNNLSEHDAADHQDATPALYLRGEVVIDNQQTFAIGYRNDQGDLAQLSQVVSLSTTEHAGIGHGATLIFIDEFARIKPLDEDAWTAIRPTIARGGQWVAGGTPNGVGGVHHRLCMQAQRGENLTYKYMEIHWSQTEITQDQYDMAVADMDADAVAQEWELGFLQTGNPVFNATWLAACYKPPEEYPEVAQALADYRLRAEEGKAIYCGGIDSMTGKPHKKSKEKDYNSMTAFTESGIQAFAHHDKSPIGTWAGRLEDDPQTDGKIWIDGKTTELHGQYPGVYYVEEQSAGETVITNHRLPDGGIQNELYRFHTNAKTKGGAVRRLKVALEGQQVVITDPFTYQCLLIYQDVGGGSYEAPPGYNDDPVISFLLAHEALLRFGGEVYTWGGDLSGLERVAGQHALSNPDQPQGPSVGPLWIHQNLYDDLPGPGSFGSPGELAPMPEPDIMDAMLYRERDDDV